MSNLEGKVALVTGGSGGIGRAICLELAARGASVIVNYNRNAVSAEDLVATIAAGDGEATALQADVSNADQVTKLFKEARTLYGTLDILVNNAGMTRDNVIMMMKPDDFDTVLGYQSPQLLALLQGGGANHDAQA